MSFAKEIESHPESGALSVCMSGSGAAILAFSVADQQQPQKRGQDEATELKLGTTVLVVKISNQRTEIS
ncbi:MAG: hypothetical protein ACE5NG_08475 [bacterium]